MIFLNICIDDAAASGVQPDTLAGINWWSLGSEYTSKPALGWSYFTFSIFMLILLYYLNRIFKQVLLERSKKITKDITDINTLEINSERMLLELNKEVSKLNTKLINIKEKSKLREKHYYDNMEIRTNTLIDKMRCDIKKNMLSNIRKIKANIKQKFVNDIFVNVVEEIAQSQDLLNNNYEDKVIQNLTEINLKLN